MSLMPYTHLASHVELVKTKNRPRNDIYIYICIYIHTSQLIASISNFGFVHCLQQTTVPNPINDDDGGDLCDDDGGSIDGYEDVDDDDDDVDDDGDDGDGDEDNDGEDDDYDGDNALRL